ncbi:MAG: condensation domain-containing protein [Firmicutes bacterium]|nr:condensation domain-containing protein [Bacillota bacterium]
MEKQIYPLSKPQELLLWSQIFTFEPKKVKESNIISIYFAVPENCDYKALEKAFNLMLERNDALRLKIFRKGLRFYQYIKEPSYRELPMVKFNSNEEFEEYLKTLPQYKVPMTGDELVWAVLADMGDCGALVMRFHHACVDGFSMSIIFKQLEDFYTAFAAGEIPPEPKKLYSVTKYFEIENDYMKSEKHENDKKFWKYAFNHQRNYSFPAGKRGRHGDCESQSVVLAENEYEALMNLCHSDEYSLQYLLMSIAALTVYRKTGKDNFCIYSLTHGRTNYVLKQTVGCMMNTVPIFYDIDTSLTIREFFKNQYMVFLDTLSHGSFSMSEQTPLSYKEAIRHKFNFNHAWMLFSAMDYGNMTVKSKYKPCMLGTTNSPFQFYCSVLEVKGEMVKLGLRYQTDKFTHEKIEELLDLFSDTVRKVLENPDAVISTLRD